MLILDKRKAVERVMALTACTADIDKSETEAEHPKAHARTYQRIATYERRPVAAQATAVRRAERRKRKIVREIEPAWPNLSASSSG